jgi:hypothetical protein|tara:strand:+ start:1678 stop:2373 length:696 start_codon:yes stop_codon:yes gene_type:complete
MRTLEQIQKIKQGQGDPYSIRDVVDVNGLYKYYVLNEEQAIQKNTGPKVLTVDPNEKVFKPLITSLKQQVGEFDIRYIHYFDVTYPHIIHNDDEFDYPNCYKAFTIPLRIYGDSEDVKLIIFDQYYYGGPVKFVNGSDMSRYPVHYNKFLTDYKDIEGQSIAGLNDIELSYLTHLQSNWLNGLSINKILDWQIGDALCFDSLALHCSSDFKSKGIERKIGLSIFTTKDCHE